MIRLLEKISLITLLLGVTLPTLSFGQSSYQTFNGKQYILVGEHWKVYDVSSNSYYDIVDSTITVKFAPTVSQSEKSNFETANNLVLLRKNILGYHDYEIVSSVGIDVLSIATALMNSEYTEDVIVPSYGEFHLTPNDPEYNPTQWYLNQAQITSIDIENAWDINTGSPNVKIAILDAGTDWEHEDLGLGADGYQNIYLNPGEDPWLSPNDPLSGNGIDDDGNGLIDDWKGYHFDQNDNDSRGDNSHGTQVAGIIGAKTNNNTGIAGVAGGWNSKGCELIICNVGNLQPNGSVLDDAILYAVDQGALIIQLSLSVLPSNDIDAAIQYAEDNGVIIVCSSGNGGNTSLDYPSSNPHVFSVGGTDADSSRYASSNYGSQLDITAPGMTILSTTLGDQYGANTGTSFSAPMVSGVAGLMLSENPCLSNQQIKDLLRVTAKKIGGYDYDWNSDKPGHSKELGYGNLVASDAVEAAQEMYSDSLDLYMRDRHDDSGVDAGYSWTWDFDDSPDIWVRNQDDGITNQEHENPEYQAGLPVYVYVQVGNKSCASSIGNEKLSLYWTKAASNSSWPQNWDGTDPSVGGLIDEVTIPTLQPGESTILTFTWNIAPNSGVGATWNNCLLARIENSITDPITVYANELGLDVYQNNNISMRNCVVTNYIPGLAPPTSGFFDRERFFYIGNSQGTADDFDIILGGPENVQNSISDVAEVNIQLDQSGWNLLQSHLENRDDIILKDSNVFSIVGSDPVILENIHFSANQRIPVKIAFNFLVDEVDSVNKYNYHVLQKYSAPHITLGNHWTGGVHFIINKGPRDVFSANAGDDMEIEEGESVTITAEQINEAAEYNWYDSNGHLIYTGTSLSVSPEVTEEYKLEVVANSDGFKDYDEVVVNVDVFEIVNLSPNPTNSFVTITYDAAGASSAYLMILGSGTTSNNYILDCSQTQSTVSVSNYQTGMYTVALVVDGLIVDAQNLVIH